MSAPVPSTTKPKALPFDPAAAQASAVSVAANGVLAAIKLAAGLWGHSYALVADAVESLGDVFSSGLIYAGLKWAEQPADSEHPYGHGRAETLAGAAVSIVLLVAALLIASQAIGSMGIEREAPKPATLAVLVFIIVFKESLFRWMLGVAKRTGSPALRSEAYHQRSDMVTSVAALIGVGVAIIGGPAWSHADSIAALLASAWMAWTGFTLLLPNLHDLMDGAPAAAVLDTIRRVSLATPGVLGVEKVFARRMGVALVADLHIEVSPTLTVREGHDIAHAVKARLGEAVPQIINVLVHVEPHGAHEAGVQLANAKAEAIESKPSPTEGLVS